MATNATPCVAATTSLEHPLGNRIRTPGVSRTKRVAIYKIINIISTITQQKVEYNQFDELVPFYKMQVSSPV